MDDTTNSKTMANAPFGSGTYTLYGIPPYDNWEGGEIAITHGTISELEAEMTVRESQGWTEVGYYV